MGLKDTWDADRDPLAALRAGDPGPFEAFVNAETPTFLAFFGRLGATRAEAEDLVQDLFFKLFRTANHYQRQGRFGAYAFRVARNAWIDRRRRRAGRPEADLTPRGDASGGGVDSVSDPGEEEPGARLARREEAARVHHALGALSERHRLVFELGVAQELPYAEIAALLEIPVGTVKSRMFHAVRKLREVLEEGGTA